MATHKRSSTRRTWVIAAVIAALVAGGTALGLSLGGGNDNAVASTPVKAPTVPAPKVSPIRATFVEARETTFYRLTVRTPEKVTYSWGLAAPKDDPSCNDFEVLKPGLAAWHHGGDQGCSHASTQHEGTVSVVVSTPDWICRASFFGTLTGTGDLPELCVASS